MEYLKNFHQQVLSLHGDVLGSCRRSGYEGKDGILLKYPSGDQNFYKDAEKALTKLVLDLTNLKKNKFPAGYTTPQQKIVSLIKDGLQDIRMIIQLSQSRQEFSSRLSDYVLERDKLEKIMLKIEGLIESTAHVPADDVASEVKIKMADLFDEAKRRVLTTARYLNALCMFSISRVPDIQGHYSWFGLFDKKQKKVVRDPWHQYVDKLEGRDLENILTSILDMIILSGSEMGMENTETLEEFQKLETLLRTDIELKVKAPLFIEKIQIMFPLLYEEDMKNQDDNGYPSEPEFHSSKSGQSVDDLEEIIGDIVNKAVRKSEDLPPIIKLKRPDISLEKYFDCQNSQIGIDEDYDDDEDGAGKNKVDFEKPKLGNLARYSNIPLGSSPTKNREWEEESVRSSKIGPETSTAKLLAYGEKIYSRSKETFEMNEEKQVLLTVKKDLERVRDKVDDFGVAEEYEIDKLQRKLYKLAINVDKKIAECDVLVERRKMIPKAKFMFWNGDRRTYSDFRKTMKELCNYGNDDLDLQTLKQQIQSKEVLKCLFNVKDLNQAFEILDRKYGNIMLMLPELKKDLDDQLENLPKHRGVESNQIQDILNVIQTLDKHGMKDAIDLSFIQLFRNKLREHNREKLMVRGVKTCDEFVAALHEIQTINDELDITDPVKVAKRHPHANFSIHGEKDKDDSKDTESANGKNKPSCLICSGSHHTAFCGNLDKKETDHKKRRDIIRSKKLCLKCLCTWTTEHVCNKYSKRFVCSIHKENRKICGCKYEGPPKPKPPKNEPEVIEADIEGEQVIQENRVTINNATIGGVGFDVEVIEFFKSSGEPMRVLVAYDTYCSHTCMDYSLAKTLGYKRVPIGSVSVKCLMGSITSTDSFKTEAVIKTAEDTKNIEFIVNESKQDLAIYHFNVPDDWVERYGIKKFATSAAGLNMCIVGKDNVHLFPKEIEVKPGIQLSRSRLTGRYIISGRATSKEGPEIAKNINMVCFQNRAVIQEKDEILFADRIVESPLKRCISCTNCLQCKKEIRPDEARQRAQTDIIKKNISFDESNGYTAVYPKNSHLKDVPSNSESVLRMMKSLENKLVKNGLVQQFNKALKEFMNTGVVSPVESFPEMNGMQESFIPLCYALANNEEANTKLRICTNSSFKTSSKYPSFNDACIDGPDYLNNMDSILSRWRCAASVAHSDISRCYHRISTSMQDNSLRRLWLKPVLGEPGEWKQFCFTKCSFGDILGGCCSQLCIYDCAERFMSDKAQKALKENAYMDDIAILKYEDSNGGCSDLKEEVEAGLNKGRLPVKGWVKSFDKSPPIKYLSYLYHPETDSIQVRPRINWSKKKRGARVSKDVKTEAELVQHIKNNPVTKRAISSVVMGSLHDPLYLMGPFTLNLKCLYREVVNLKLDWDEKVPPAIEDQLFLYLKPFLKMEKVLFPRRVAFLEAVIIEFLLFYDGSNAAVGAAIYVRNIFRDGTEIIRLLRNKVKLVPSDANTTPRSELLACLVCLRMYHLLKTDLKTFFDMFTGTVKFKVFSDSKIVLHQLLKDAFNFKLWVSVRVSEVQQLSRNMDPEVEFFHISSSLNKADILTRPYIGEPEELPYIGNCEVDISNTTLFNKETHGVSTHQLPEYNKKQVHVDAHEVRLNLAHIETANPCSGVVDLNFMVHYNKMKANPLHIHDPEENVIPLISRLMKQKSRYYVIKNILARVMFFGLKQINFQEAQEKAEMFIFKQYQESVADYIRGFRGSKYYISYVEGVTFVTGRKIDGVPKMLKLVPPKTELYNVLTKTFHKKYHYFGPNYIRAQLQLNGFYVPSAMKRLKKLQDSCVYCRKKKPQIQLHTEMGSLGHARLTPQGAFMTLVSDICGPFKCVGYIDRRKTSKVWVLVNICDFTRHISLHLLENMSSNCLLQAFRKQFLRFGKSSVISADFGSNYSGAKDALLDETETELITHTLQSEGTQLIQRSPKMPWVQGSSEHSIFLTKRAIPVKESMNFFQWDRALEEAMVILNNRPLGVFADMEILTPNSLNPVHSGMSAANSLQGYCEKVTDFKRQFEKKWFSNYYETVLQQAKWSKTNHQLKKDDIVMITDLFTPLGYPVVAKISQVETDGTGIERYFVLQYKRMKVDTTIRRADEKVSFSPNFQTVKRPANSLILLVSSTEKDDQTANLDNDSTEQSRVLHTFPDILNYVQSDPGSAKKQKDKVRISHQYGNVEISDI